MRLPSLFPDLEEAAPTVRPLTSIELAPYGLHSFHQALGELRIPAGWAAAVQPSPLHSRFPGVGDGRTHWRLVVRFSAPSRKPRRPDVDMDAHIEWVTRPRDPWRVRSFALHGNVGYTPTAQAAIDLVAASIGAPA